MQFGPHRQLHKIAAGQLGIDRFERGGVDHVFSVVKQHGSKADTAAPLVGAERGVEPVEAIGLGGGSVRAVDDQPDPRIIPGPVARRGQGRGVVDIAPDIDPQGLLRPGLQHVGHRGGDHRAFLKRRDQHRGRPRQRPLTIAGAQAPGLGAPGQPQPQPREIEREFIGQPDAEPECGESQQLALERQQPVQRRVNPRSRLEHSAAVAPAQCTRKLSLSAIVRGCNALGTGESQRGKSELTLWFGLPAARG